MKTIKPGSAVLHGGEAFIIAEYLDGEGRYIGQALRDREFYFLPEDKITVAP